MAKTANEKLLDWSNRLLDMSGRNRMLNFKENSGCLRFVRPSSDELFRLLTDGVKLEAAVRGDSREEAQISAADDDKLAAKLKKSQILPNKNDYYTRRILYRMRGRARSAVEEQGINILYMAFGILEWQDEYSETFLSPLLLVPVKVTVESLKAPYNITEFEDDIILNKPLAYKMKQSYKITLPEFDEDKHTSLSAYLEELRISLQDKGWKITDSVYLGLFSFSKLNMFMDVSENREELLKSPVIKSICGEAGMLSGFKADDFTSELDSKFGVRDTYCVVDADSSQLDAVYQLKQGKSFVLQGPPGTGKSQTITNLIAESLAAGKKVLFVSEKAAALNVVFNKLEKVGLEDFCLALHSHKANKQDVITELKDTLTTARSKVNNYVYDELDTLDSNRKSLNEYAAAVHNPIEPIKRSAYEIFGEFSAVKDAPEINYNISGLAGLSMADYNGSRKLLNQFLSYIPVIGSDYRKNCNFGYSNPDNSFTHPTAVKEMYEIYIKAAVAFFGADEAISQYSGHTPTADSAAYKINYDLYTAMAALQKVPEVWLQKEELTLAETLVKKLMEECAFVADKKKEICKRYSEEVFEYDFEDTAERFKSDYNSGFRVFKGSYRSDKKTLLSYLNSGKKPDFEEMRLTVYKIKKVQDAIRAIKEKEGEYSKYLEGYYTGEKTDCEAIEKLLEDYKRIASFRPAVSSKLKALITSGALKEDATFIELLKRYGQKNGALISAAKVVAKDYDADLYDPIRAPYRQAADKFLDCIKKIGTLQDYIGFLPLMKLLKEKKLLEFIDMSLDMGVLPEQFADAYSRRFWYLWSDEAIKRDPVLSRFTREEHEDTVKTFREKDVLWFKIAQARIRELLSKERPNYNAASPNSEIRILMREAEKKRRQMSVRKLFSEIPKLIMTLKPCLLMSPMSVSQFIDPKLIRFDVVIFDEASQIFPEDALGAIYRGRQLVVAGDINQLPPTDFFTSASGIGDYDSEDEDSGHDCFESLLEVCNQALNIIPLKWHYRSRYESLIAFSNRFIYNNGLVSFPAAVKAADDTGVEFVHVPEGVYDRSNSRTNRKEGEKVASIVFHCLERHPERSLGVVAFSEAQQELIERIIYDARLKNPSFEKYFDENALEPFFVKNIESVQGDERDTIIFSVGYARDDKGKMYMNFGPLSRDGGERRLNVAVTRARINVKLVSSILPTDINADNSKLGVKLLRDYIQYAMDGRLPPAAKTGKNFDEEHDLIERSVLKFLTDNRYSADLKVGCSDYKLDIAVKDPEDPEVYILGIECDGGSYRRNRTARDRDRLRDEVLCRLDWKIYRIWSADWIKRRETEEKKLLEAVRAAVSGEKSAHNKAISAIPEMERPVETAAAAVPEDNSIAEYEEVKLADYYKPTGSVDMNFKKVMDAIMEKESPVHIEAVLKKLAPVFGYKLVSDNMRTQFKYQYSLWKPENVIYNNHYFYFANKKAAFRRAKPGAQRNIDYVSEDELIDGIKKFVAVNVGISREGLIREISAALGYGRVNDKLQAVINPAIDKAILRKAVREDAGKIRSYS